jgi:dATP pyrophosphohydrolase
VATWRRDDVTTRPPDGVTPKLPVSVLVVIHTPALDVLMLERAQRPGYWQSVTGSLDRFDEAPEAAAMREVREETGIEAQASMLERTGIVNVFEIYSHWRHRFAPGTTHNTEHVFWLQVPRRISVALAPDEHTASLWLPWQEAAVKCFSWSNQDAIRALARRARASTP